MKSHFPSFTILIALLLLASCGKDNPSTTEPDPSTPPVNPNTVSKDIGSDGGSVTSSDDLLTLTIPAGAVANTETISITPLDTDDLGTEFEQLLAAGGIAKAYELEPDGLEFDQPVEVSFGSTQAPVKNNDTLSVFSEVLFTSSDGTLELLDSLQTSVDFDNGTVTVKGQLSHFSPLVTSQSNNGVSFFVFDVPDMLEMGSSFTAKAQIFRSLAGPLGDIVTVPGPAMYKDRSGTPIVAVSSPHSGELPGNSTDGFTGSFDYTCNDLGLGIYQSDLSVQVIFNLDSGEIPAESYAVFLTTVDCVEALPSTVDLQVTLDGDGSGSISSNPTGIDCPNDCEEMYEEGTEVTLTATPDEGSVFAGWSGDIGENEYQNLSITVIMDQARSVTAAFEVEQPSITPGVYSAGTFFPQGIILIPNPWGLLSFNSNCAFLLVVAGLDLAIVDPCSGNTLAVLDITSEISTVGLNGLIPLLPTQDVDGVSRNWLLLTTQQSGWVIMEIVLDVDGNPQMGEIRKQQGASNFIWSVSGTGGMDGADGGTNSALIVDIVQSKIIQEVSDPTVSGAYDGVGKTLLSLIDGTLPGPPSVAYQQTPDGNNTPGDITGITRIDGTNWVFTSSFNTETGEYNTAVTGEAVVGEDVRDMDCVENPNSSSSEAEVLCVTANLGGESISLILKKEDNSVEVKTENPIDAPIAIEARLTPNGTIQVFVGSFLSQVYIAEYDFSGNLIDETDITLPTGLDGLSDVGFFPLNPGWGVAGFQNSDNISVFEF